MRLLLAAFAFTMLLVAPAAAAPLETYGHLPTLDEVIISPDGEKLAYVRPRGTDRVILVEDIVRQKPIRALTLDGQKLRQILWAGPGHLIIVTSQAGRLNSARWISVTRQEFMQAQIYDLATGKFRLVLGDQQDVGNFLRSAPQLRTIDGKPVLFVEGLMLGSEAKSALFRVDVATGKARPVDFGPVNANISVNWAVNGEGVPVARTEYHHREGVWRLQTRGTNGLWRTVRTGQAAISPPWLAGLADREGHVLLASIQEDEEVYDRVSLVDGASAEQLEARGVQSFLFDDLTARLIGVSEGEEGRRSVRFFSSADQIAWNRLTRAFPDERVTLQSWSSDRQKVVVQVQGKKTGNAYLLIDQAAGRADLVDEAYRGLTPDRIAPAQWVSYKASDGLDIQGVLTLPLGVEPKSLPLVVLVHGGPESHDDLGFDWWAQALASRGYAVFQPNFRGSSGYGPAFVQAGYGEWGRRMQSDVSDGVRHLIEQKMVDGSRICVIGASYGGYSALAGVTLEQGIYRCAAAVAGVADLRRMLDYLRTRTGNNDNNALRYWRRFMGVEKRGEEALDALSPARLASRAQVPVLLIHGKDDTVVPYDQSVHMAKALEAAGRNVEFVTLAGEDHWLSRSDTRLQMLKSTVDFLERHNPPRAAAN